MTFKAIFFHINAASFPNLLITLYFLPSFFPHRHGPLLPVLSSLFQITQASVPSTFTTPWIFLPQQQHRELFPHKCTVSWDLCTNPRSTVRGGKDATHIGGDLGGLGYSYNIQFPLIPSWIGFLRLSSVAFLISCKDILINIIKAKLQQR